MFREQGGGMGYFEKLTLVQRRRWCIGMIDVVWVISIVALIIAGWVFHLHSKGTLVLMVAPFVALAILATHLFRKRILALDREIQEEKESDIINEG